MKLKNWRDQFEIVIYDEVASTHHEALAMSRVPKERDVLLWARNQTHSIANMARQWSTSRGNFHLSMLLRKHYPLTSVSQLQFVATISLYDAIMALQPSLSPALLKLKWPNELMLDGKRCASVLLESRTGFLHTIAEAVIVSISMNIATVPSSSLSSPSTSLSEHNIAISPDILLDQFVAIFMDYVALWESEGFAPIQSLWMNHAFALERAITITHGNNRISGVFYGIDQHGHLRLQLTHGEEMTLPAGEICIQ